MTHNSGRPLYILPFRVVVLAVAGVLLLGFLGGALASWLLVRRLVRVAPGGERIIERVERVPVASEDTLATVARESASSIATLLDAAGKELGQTVAVTADGLFVGVGAPPKAPIQLRVLSGETLPASLARVYPEGNLFFVRTSGTFSVPSIARETLPPPGASLAAVARSPVGSVGGRVHLVTVERMDFSGFLQETYSALTLVPMTASPLPSSFQGAPLFSADRRLQGLALIQQDSTGVIGSPVLDFYLQDALKHPSGVNVSVLSGLRGRPVVIQDKQEPLTVAFRVTEVASGSPWADQDMTSGDEIQRVNGQMLTVASPLARVLLEAARSNKPASLEIRRGAETLTRDVPVTIR